MNIFESNFIKKCFLPLYKSFYKVELPSKTRIWMDETNYHAYKCLPLNVANRFGWEILNPIKFDAIWNGDKGFGEETIKFNFYPENEEENNLVKENTISSHFGNGIITFSGLNFILQTNKDTNIFVKGPTNHFKYNAQALEAIIETDWLPYTFTLNWKIIKPNEIVKFEKNEPIATFFPIPRGYIESFKTEEIQLTEKDDLFQEHEKWVFKRQELNKTEKEEHSYYMRGIKNIKENKIFENHQKFISGCPFKKLKELL
jgi:hypothetical protein